MTGPAGCLAYRVDAAAGRAVITYHAEPTFAEWAAAVDAVLANPAFAPGFGILFDRRAIDSAPSVDYIRQTAAHLAARSAQLTGRRLAMVTGAPAAYGMARLGEVRAERAGVASAVFYDLAAAEVWLTATT